jgi:hypothetical protein
MVRHCDDIARPGGDRGYHRLPFASTSSVKLEIGLQDRASHDALRKHDVEREEQVGFIPHDTAENFGEVNWFTLAEAQTELAWRPEHLEECDEFCEANSNARRA